MNSAAFVACSMSHGTAIFVEFAAAAPLLCMVVTAGTVLYSSVGDSSVSDGMLDRLRFDHCHD
jgi:hypothetical protein